MKYDKRRIVSNAQFRHYYSRFQYETNNHKDLGAVKNNLNQTLNPHGSAFNRSRLQNEHSAITEKTLKHFATFL